MLESNWLKNVQMFAIIFRESMASVVPLFLSNVFVIYFIFVKHSNVCKPKFNHIFENYFWKLIKKEQTQIIYKSK